MVKLADLSYNCQLINTLIQYTILNVEYSTTHFAQKYKNIYSKLSF